jgi:uncharacterized caspase-like protein
LIIGNSTYAAVEALANPARDAASIGDALRDEGFEVTTIIDATRQQMLTALQNFQDEADRSDWAIIYFAGHGMEMGGHDYLIPVDAKLADSRNVEDEAVSLDRVQAAVGGASGLRLILLDACRNNPFLARMKRTAGATRAVARGLEAVEPDPGALLVFATRGGEAADDGGREHSPFTAALLKEIRVPGLEVRRLFDAVRDDVLESTGRRQMPFSYGSLSANVDYYFVAKK